MPLDRNAPLSASAAGDEASGTGPYIVAPFRASLISLLAHTFRKLERASKSWQEPGGRLIITLPNGTSFDIGQENWRETTARVHFRTLRAVWRMLRHGALGFAEAYMAGDIACEDLTALFRFYIRNERRLDGLRKHVRLVRADHRRYHRTRANHRRGARHNIRAHYDLGNAFYAQWLDPGMTYSSAYFLNPTMGLEAAQQAKYHRILDLANLKPGDHILEIGCGWGGLAECAARRGIHVTGVTLSREQLAYARERISQAGLDHMVALYLQDYRDSHGTYDAIISIEMIEAVGEDYWPVYFQALASRLKPGGNVVLQAITIADQHFDAYSKRVDFIQRYIFPGGMLLSPSRLYHQARRVGFTQTYRETFAEDYARTLRLWRDAFRRNWPEIAPMGFDAAFYRRWLYYLSYCEAGFEEETISVGFYRLEHNAIA